LVNCWSCSLKYVNSNAYPVGYFMSFLKMLHMDLLFQKKKLL
jgi:hypothetical protein